MNNKLTMQRFDAVMEVLKEVCDSIPEARQTRFTANAIRKARAILAGEVERSVCKLTMHPFNPNQRKTWPINSGLIDVLLEGADTVVTVYFQHVDDDEPQFTLYNLNFNELEQLSINQIEAWCIPPTRADITITPTNGEDE